MINIQLKALTLHKTMMTKYNANNDHQPPESSWESRTPLMSINVHISIVDAFSRFSPAGIASLRHKVSRKNHRPEEQSFSKKGSNSKKKLTKTDGEIKANVPRENHVNHVNHVTRPLCLTHAGSLRLHHSNANIERTYDSDKHAYIPLSSNSSTFVNAVFAF